MKNSLLFFVLLLMVPACESDVVANNKDLEQNMMDLKIYQENLGDHIKSKKLNDASWFLEGMDSILHIVGKRFEEHHKLHAPFLHYYKKEMKDPIEGIREAIHDNDTAKALQQYRILVKNCNNCHIDHDIDKTVNF